MSGMKTSEQLLVELIKEIEEYSNPEIDPP